jgi:tRNA pseudouridine55 synthase
MLIDKPAGWTSHDVVAVVRRNLRLRAVGHAGTLDPFATGLLVVMVGRATRLARFAEAAEKEYHAVIRFGAATDTDDATGRVIKQTDPPRWPDRASIEAVLPAFTGALRQRPPAYSAKHVAGERSHRLARAGKAVELQEVTVQVHALAAERWEPPDLHVRAVVGKGTYLRALARDVGEALGVPAHCAELRRERVGSFRVADAVAPEAADVTRLRPPLAMVPDLPRLTLDAASERDVGFGRRIAREGGEGPVALVGAAGTLVAVAEADGDWWQPVVVLEPAG